MKNINIYKKLGLNDEENIFNYLMTSFKKTNRTYNFFVDLSKVFQNINNIEIELNIMNYLIDKENIENEFKNLIKQQPSIVSTIPILIAIREKSLEVLSNFKNTNWQYKTYTFKKKKFYSEDEIDQIIEFCKKIGLLKLLSDRKIKNLVKLIT